MTTISYDSMSRVWKTTLPDNTSVTNEFFITGQLKKTYGSRTYPVEYTYDAQGRMKTMKTWKDFAGNTGTATTTWNYDVYRSWLTNKTYDGAAAGPTYAYTTAGRLQTRTWARGITTGYAYNNAGDLMRMDYSDSTPDVGYGYDRRGRQTTVTNDATLVCTFAYNDASQLLRETHSSGPLSGLGTTNVYDHLLRRTNVSTVGVSTTYRYDDGSRLWQVSDGTNTAGYAYLANSPLVSHVTFTNSGALRMTTTKQYDLLNRLTNISTLNDQPSTINSFNYAYNSANQRTSVTNLDSSRWIYIYDSLGQVTSGKKYWSDGTNVAAQQFEYTFDDIGNRKTTAAGGNEFGTSLRSANYTNNALNQILQRDVPGYADIMGEATNTATVNDQPTYRHDEYFRAELTVTNTSAAVWLGVTNLAVINDGTNVDIVASATGNVFVAQSPESFGYDADGNMTNDGRWALTWDAENRLTKAESLSSAPTTSKRKVEWTYDYRERRVQQTASDGNSGSFVVTEDLKFVSDGWRHIAELNATNNTLVRSYAWGTDLSGALDGAGGVGGLLLFNSTANGVHFYAYDGNGNVSALVRATNATTSADYEFDAFGRTLRSTGAIALENPFRFSTKRANETTDFVLYEYRLYIPSLGRWASRDPLGDVQLGQPELATKSYQVGNLYLTVANDMVDSFDVLGLLKFFKNECQGCNAGFYDHTPAQTCKENAAGTYVPGATGSFDHSCSSGSPALCDTETHIFIKARNDDGCCDKWFITCSFSYEGEANASYDVWLNVTQLSFLGTRVAPRASLIAYAGPKNTSSPGPPYHAFLSYSSWTFGVATIRKGTEKVVFRLEPRNRVNGGRSSISEKGHVSCTAKCAWDLRY